MGPMMDNRAPPTENRTKVPTSEIKAFVESYAEDMSAQESVLASHLQQMRSFQSRTIPSDISQALSEMMNDLETLTEGYAALWKKITSFQRVHFANVKEKTSESSTDTRRKSKPTGARKGPLLTGDESAPESGAKPANKTGHRSASSSITPGPTEAAAFTQHRLWPGQKRPWAVDETETPHSSDSAENSVQKRRRTTRDIPGGDEDVSDFIPVAMQKDDISDEVERRLQLKEERRRKLNAAPEKKRKRENWHSGEVIPAREENYQVGKRQKAITAADAES